MIIEFIIDNYDVNNDNYNKNKINKFDKEIFYFTLNIISILERILTFIFLHQYKQNILFLLSKIAI